MRPPLPLILLALLMPVFSFAQNTLTVNPDSAYQGETLDVTIMGQSPFYSGSNTFNGYNYTIEFTQGPPTYAYFFTGSNTLVQLLNPNEFGITGLNIAPNQDTGWYTLNLVTGSSTFFNQPAAFYIYTAPQINTNCSALFTLYPDSATPHHWYALNQATGTPPITYSWNWGDGSSADIGATPSHTYADSGYYNICLTITDGTGCTSTYCNSSTFIRSTEGLMITVNVVTSLPTGILQLEKGATLHIFPNPANNSFIVETAVPGTQLLEVYDITGKLLLSESIQNNQTTIDASGFASGVYVVSLKTTGGTLTQKLVIAK